MRIHTINRIVADKAVEVNSARFAYRVSIQLSLKIWLVKTVPEVVEAGLGNVILR